MKAKTLKERKEIFCVRLPGSLFRRVCKAHRRTERRASQSEALRAALEDFASRKEAK